MRSSSILTGILSILAFTLPACVDAEVEDGENDGFPSGKADGGIDEGSAEALGVLALVNDGTLTAAKLKTAAGITSRVSTNIVKHRNGADSAVGTADDDLFDTLALLRRQATFENALHLSGAQYAGLFAAFESNFANIWRTGPTLLAPLRSQITTSPTIPLVFPSMSLSYAEFESLRALIRTNCTVADSDEYRSNATAHRTCPR